MTAEDIFLNFGPLGASVVVLGWVAFYFLKRSLAELDAYREKNDEMVRTLYEVIPLLKRSAEIHEKRQSTEDEMREVLNDARTLIRDIRRDTERRQ